MLIKVDTKIGGRMKASACTLLDFLIIPILYLMGFQTARSLSRAMAMMRKLSQLTVMFFIGFMKWGNRRTYVMEFSSTKWLATMMIKKRTLMTARVIRL